MAYGNNPAERLLQLLTAAKVYTNDSPVPAWANVFGLEQTDANGVLRMGVSTIELAAETRRTVEALSDDDPELILRSYSGVEATVGNFAVLAAHQTMTNFLLPYNELAEYSLQMAASLLRRRQSERVLADADLERLRARCRDLIDIILPISAVDPELKLWIVDLLRKIEDALTNVAVTGTPGIENAADRLVGGLIRHPSRTARLIGHPIWKGIAGLVLTLNTVLASVVEYQQITSDQQQQIIVQVVQPPTDGPPEITQGG